MLQRAGGDHQRAGRRRLVDRGGHRDAEAGVAQDLGGALRRTLAGQDQRHPPPVGQPRLDVPDHRGGVPVVQGHRLGGQRQGLAGVGHVVGVPGVEDVPGAEAGDLLQLARLGLGDFDRPVLQLAQFLGRVDTAELHEAAAGVRS